MLAASLLLSRTRAGPPCPFARSLSPVHVPEAQDWAVFANVTRQRSQPLSVAQCSPLNAVLLPKKALQDDI